MASGIMSGAMNSDVMEATESPSTNLKLIPMPSVNGPTQNGIISQPSLQWSRWQELPDSTSIYAPAAVSPSANRIDVFRIATDSKMYHNWWDGSKWNVWTPLGDKVFTSAPTAISPSRNRIDVFGISTDKQIYRQSWDGSKWNEQWESLGGVCIHGLAATSSGPNRIDLFAVGTNSCLYHKWWDGSGWNGWEPLKLKDRMDWEKSSTTIYAPTAIASENRIDLFAVGIDNHIYQAWWDGEEWIGWEKVDGPCIQGIAVTSREKNLDLFTIGTDIEGTDNHLYHSVWDSSNWGNWENLGGACISAPAVVTRDTNKLDTFVIGTRNAIYQKSWGQTGEGAGAQGESSPNYTDVQYIGYVIPTSVFIEEVETQRIDSSLGGIVDGRVTQKYLGSADFEQDWESRCTLMQEAIDLAYQNADKNSSTLKIFMAPEFYFRGPLGAYELTIFDKIVNRLRSMVSDEKWKDWLFVFGSILGCAELTTGKKEIYNTVLVQKGWIPDMNDSKYGAKAVVKEYISWIDFAWKKNASRPRDIVDKDGNRIPKGTVVEWKLVDETVLKEQDVQEIFSNPSGLGKERQQWNYDGRGIFEIDGITFGLEICLDHAKRRLRLSPPAPGQTMVQIQLITSAGMGINADAVVACTNGHVFNCDGSGDSGHAYVAKVASTFSNFSNATVSYDSIFLSKVNVPKSSSVNQPELYFEKSGELYVYRPLTLPLAVLTPRP